MSGLRQIIGKSLAGRFLGGGGNGSGGNGGGEEVAADPPVAEALTPSPQPERRPLAHSTTTLAEVSRELAAWVPILRRLAEAEALRDLALGHCAEITAPAVRTIIAARRLRDQYFWPAMNETAWTLLLELFTSRLEGRRLDVAALSAATDIPFATSLHWIDWLSGRGVVRRNEKAEEGGAVDLTDAGADEMRAYLLASLRLSPWVQ